MLKQDVHRAISKKRTGKTFEELHKWIDEGKDKNHFYSDEVRDFIFNNFGGKEAVSEWLFHIALDGLDSSVNYDWKELESDKNFFKLGFEDYGFIHYQVDELNEDLMDEEFPENDVEEE